MELKRAWESESQAWLAYACSPAADPVFWAFNLPLFLQRLPTPGRLTLDVGCGEGRVSRALRAHGHRVIGLDTAPTLVAAASAHPEGAPVAVADGAALPFPDGTADLVVLFMVLHDADDLAAVLHEASRVLEPQGRLCIAMSHPIQGIGDFAGADREGDYVVTRPWFEEKRLTYRAERAGQSVALHFTYRPLTAYTAALEQAGFVLEHLSEPAPDPSLDDVLTDAAQRRAVASFLHMRARKDGSSDKSRP